MLSIKNKFLFIHIPKTGGNSIQKSLVDYSEDEIVVKLPVQDGINRFAISSKYDVKKHSTLLEYKNKIDADLYSQIYKFSVIRNPWDRVVSLYFHSYRTWNKKKFTQTIKDAHKMRDFIRLEKPAQGLAGYFKQGIDSSPLDQDIDFLIHFENIDEDFKTVCEKLNIPYRQLSTLNQSKRSEYTNYYDNSSRKLVEKLYADEIDFGKYTYANK